MFTVAARTVLELGAELISSDVIAFYELIKNAFDAKSSNGAEIHFRIVLRHNEYLKFLQRADGDIYTLKVLKQDIENALEPSAAKTKKEKFMAIINGAKNKNEFMEYLKVAYIRHNSIVVSDKGTGMSEQDLTDNYLTIGTTSRAKHFKNADSKKGAPYLGEKGIGRLAAMRLGDKLKVETAIEQDNYFNILKIDWSDFGGFEIMLEDIKVKPERGNKKPDPDWSGTRIIIRNVSSDWTRRRANVLGESELARLTDPFSNSKRRPRIAIFWNGERIPVARMDQNFLKHAHASVKGRFIIEDSEPTLEYELVAGDLGFDHPREVEQRSISLYDLQGLIEGESKDIPLSSLTDLGAFEFEAYWFNRQRLGRIDSIGEQAHVRELQRRWSGILLFRDGFRVLPYGEEDDDWLSLDRKALSSSGYLLNKTQYIGRVTISRLGNPFLIDQTNREGLRVRPEQQAFVNILQLAIQDHLREFLKDVKKRYIGQPVKMDEVKTNVSDLEKRTKIALRKMRKEAPEQSKKIEQLELMFNDMKEWFEHTRNRVEEVEAENRQMMHMAGVGLLVEVVAHELARSTENALASLDVLRSEDVPEQVEGLFNALRADMKSVNKRIRVLDPLSVSGRQRKEKFELCSLIDDIVSGHERQFERHDIGITIHKTACPVRVQAVKGMFVQIFENLISNSIYWLALRKNHESGFVPHITISIENDPLRITYKDNGRGIAAENRDNIFRAFFSLKEKSKRRGLGLYIARDCAEYHGGSLELNNHADPETGRLHQFALYLPESIVLS